MNLTVDGKAAYAYTANHDIDPAKRTAVFIHGAGLDHSSFGLQSRYFGYHGWNVLAVDLPAHGRSAGPALTTVPAMADWVMRLLDSEKISRATLVGHSMGSLVCAESAARLPLGRDATPGMWSYGDTQARLERLAPGVLYNDLKACNDYLLEGEVRCPALFVLGERDVMTPPRRAKEIQEKIPDAKTVRIALSGHTLMTEAPDQTLDALIDFFRT